MTLGASSASPRATTRIASTSSGGRTSLSRKPLAPARSAAKTYSSTSWVVRMMIRAAAAGGDDPPSRLDPVDDRHADVHQHDVGPSALDQRDRLGAVGGLADDLDVVAGVEDHAEAAAHERLVVGDQDADAHGAASSGSRAWTR